MPPHMKRAREAILSRGGGVKSNVFTRALLSLFGVLRWHSVPVMPVEIMLLPKWFPFHIDKISYWARTVIVPLLVLQALKPQAINPRGVTIDELFREDPQTIGAPHKAPHQKWSWFLGFRVIDIVLRAVEPVMPKGSRKRAIDKARGVRHRAPQRHRRARRDLPGNGKFREDVCGARLSAGSSAPHDRARLARQASRRQGRRGLLPALRLAGVGYRAGRARAARSGRREGGCGCEQGPRLAQAAAGARREGRLDRAAAERAAGRLGVPVQQRALSRSRRHRRGRRWRWTACAASAARSSTQRSSARANGSSACKAGTAVAARSTPTTTITISTTSRSRITARCSTRRPPT